MNKTYQKIDGKLAVVDTTPIILNPLMIKKEIELQDNFINRASERKAELLDLLDKCDELGIDVDEVADVLAEDVEIIK